jgi:hypothetical protein
MVIQAKHAKIMLVALLTVKLAAQCQTYVIPAIPVGVELIVPHQYAQ